MPRQSQVNRKLRWRSDRGRELEHLALLVAFAAIAVDPPLLDRNDERGYQVSPSSS